MHPKRTKHENYEAHPQCRYPGCELLAGYPDKMCEYHHEDRVRRETKEDAATAAESTWGWQLKRPGKYKDWT